MQQISDLNLKILLSQRLMGLVRKKHLVGIAPNQTSPPFAEREGFTLCIPNAPAGAQQMASSFGASALPNAFYGSIH
ncbi:MAG: hypothetical protein IKQ89_07660 [Muribaculaceae bacterium]|nr:hypothetical protein [Muribaculaceae bacterium]